LLVAIGLDPADEFVDLIGPDPGKEGSRCAFTEAGSLFRNRGAIANGMDHRFPKTNACRR
jgi:hypothetical protein